MKRYLKSLLFMFCFCLTACEPGKEKSDREPASSAYDNDVAFLKKYSDVIELTDSEMKSRIAVMPGLQARVMTSTCGPPENVSYGWINRSLFESGDTSVHMNAYGGEERFWLGPEGGQFSIFFEKGSAFTLENWHTPRLIDLDPFELVAKTSHAATFTKTAVLKNYSGTLFNIKINREIKVLDPSDAFRHLGMEKDTSLNTVAYQSINTVENSGKVGWDKKTGLLSIWLLGMFNPSASLTIIIPFIEGSDEEAGPVVNDDYFGKVPADRIRVKKNFIFFKGDGEYRSKIGLGPARAKGILGSYDSKTRTLTIVKYSEGKPTDDYVNSKWEIQTEPYKGDVVNAYNDGAPAPGQKPMGPFYELESSSPAKELKPGEQVMHKQTTFHFQGEEEKINRLTIQILGVSIREITSAFETN